ncbi:hypothetical protein INP83_05865 [Mucilaginibacter sp. 21P]|uniref:hypothetical protein n=1 Tax=Mucilaginibacter sp. 21P TaxID=2778902 RepID=UPI001C560662|nr:hypothetical protein [Mucilaginibacter sp. 21P]QXV66606.1 hypothetical protein INP83_05865 [Mucilaginibacter sp. 21P]
MKKLLYLIPLLLTACVGNNNNKADDTAKKDIAKTATAPAATDTMFLQKEKTKDYYHIVYVEKNHAAQIFKDLVNFKFDHYDTVNYKQAYRVLKVRNPKPLKKYDLAGLPNEWLPVYTYRGERYLYAPADWGNADKRMITDSTIIYRGEEGPEPHVLNDFKKIGNNKYNLKAPPFYQFVKKSNINIYIIDPKTKLSVWEDTELPPAYRYRMYVPRQSAGSYNMVVNYCKAAKMPEFEFDKVNYQALIKNR